MSQRYKGGVISATPPTTSTSSASGVWTEQQFMQGVASGNWPALAGAPTIGTATAGSLSASVTFTAPTYVGSGITGYTVTSNPSGITGTGASSPVTVSGLTAGTPYTFTVTATTAAGQGSASAASNSVTPTPPNYIEDVFSTYLYTGNATTGQSINNGIDLATKGGLLWCKNRTTGSTPHYLFDTARDFSYSNAAVLNTASTAAQEDKGTDYAKPETNGFSFGSGAGSTSPNKSGDAFASWTFRKQPKFFDVVTYTGDGTGPRAISHNLGSTPGCIFVKRTSGSQNWEVYHRSLTSNQYYLELNQTSAQDDSGQSWDVTSTTFNANSNLSLNTNGATYVAYLFAHNAGGFGLTGTDNVISCGSFSASMGSLVNIGFEPQFVLIKKTTNVDDWLLFDNMRGLTMGDDSLLNPNTSGAENNSPGNDYINPQPTGFTQIGFGSGTFIYIAIRRGPMKVPTSGTSVFDVGTRAGSASVAKTNSNILTDLAVIKRFTSGAEYWAWTPRLVGNLTLQSNSTDAELQGAMATNPWDTMTGAFCAASNGATNTSTLVDYSFRRAPGFFDEVCYTGTGSASTVAHNLGVAPELIMLKKRSAGGNDWVVYSQPTGNQYAMYLNLSYQGDSGSTAWNSTSPTSSVFSLGASGGVNGGGSTFVAYLFASCPGVSKVGSYTGTGTTQTINCGFTSGSRFVLIKRTDSTGDWYVWDSARGIIAGNDPYLLLNSTAAEVTNTDYVDTAATGFEISSTAPAAINANGGTFIFLAIA